MDKIIPLRDFNRNPSKYLKQLPVSLTQYNKVVCYVIPANDNSSIEKDQPESDATNMGINKSDATIEKDAPDTNVKVIVQNCEVPFCKNIMEDIWNVYDGDGGERRANLCKKHLSLAKRENPEGQPS